MNLKLKSSTVMEVIVALTIISIIIAISFFIIANLNKNNNINLKYRASILIDNQLNTLSREPEELNDTLLINTIKLVRNSQLDEQYKDLWNVEIKAFTQFHKLLYQKKAIIKNNE